MDWEYKWWLTFCQHLWSGDNSGISFKCEKPKIFFKNGGAVEIFSDWKMEKKLMPGCLLYKKLNEVLQGK